METEKRIKKVINWLIYREVAENERDLSERLGYTKSSFSQIVNGKVPLSEKFVGRLCSLDENLNSVWILTGEGEMFLGGYPFGEKTAPPTDEAHIVGDNNNWSNVNSDETLRRALEEIAEQRKLTAAAQANIDHLLSVISELTSKLQ